MTRTLLLMAIFALAGIGASYAAGDVQTGKTKAAACAGCHGANGEGVGPNPPLAGMNETQFTQAINDYKSGKRANAAMKMFASRYSDQDMADMAAYYASLPKK
jgi:cytochrome c553